MPRSSNALYSPIVFLAHFLLWIAPKLFHINFIRMGGE